MRTGRWVVFVGMVVAWVAGAHHRALGDDRVASATRVSERWPWALEVGGGTTYRSQANLEATLSPDMGGPHVSIGLTTGQSRRVYVDVGASLFLSIAAGVGWRSPQIDALTYHLFVGLPIPIFGLDRGGFSSPFAPVFYFAPFILYIDPFYRPEWETFGAIRNEFGTMVKIRVALTREQWRRPGYNAADGVVW